MGIVGVCTAGAAYAFVPYIVPPSSTLEQPAQLVTVNASTTTPAQETIEEAAVTPSPKARFPLVHEQKPPTERVDVHTVSEEVFNVPFYSQFTDISAPEWKKIGCGIASLAMLVDFYKPAVPVDTLLQEGIAARAYLNNAGWTHAGLIELSEKYGLTGASKDMAGASMSTAFNTLRKVLDVGPVMVSVHYTFDPTNPIPHLVVINGITDDLVYYNDPAEPAGGGAISIDQFQSAWKKRYIEIRPTT